MRLITAQRTFQRNKLKRLAGDAWTPYFQIPRLDTTIPHANHTLFGTHIETNLIQYYVRRISGVLYLNLETPLQ